MKLRLSDFDLHPLALPEAHGRKDKSGNLIAQHAHPDTDDPPAEDITTEIGNDGTDESDAYHGCNCCVKRVSCTTQASHVDDLADLENDNKDYDMHNLDSNCHNVVFRKKQMVETAGTKIVDRNQTDSDDSTDETTGAAVFFGKIRIAGT